MKFTALPVNVGDSFLLHSNDKYVLVDGGMNKSHIITLLNKEKIKNKHIHYIICTHYDADHVNGILGILKSGKYSFNELWLPEIFGSLTYTISSKIDSILKYWRENQYDLVEILHDEIENTRDEYKGDYNRSQYEDISLSVIGEFIKYSTHYNGYWSRHILDLNNESSSMNMKINSSLIKICSLIHSSITSGSHIRWFKYQNYNTRHKCQNSFVAENSIETGITSYSPEIFFKMAYLTTINKESLVFSYESPDHANVLFSADSDLHFYNSPKQLSANSIVTAPHHGSESNNSAYSKITGDKLIYIRSDRCQIRRPGKGFLEQNRRYCTVCKTEGPKQKITVNYKHGLSPNIYGKPCICDTL